MTADRRKGPTLTLALSGLLVLGLLEGCAGGVDRPSSEAVPTASAVPTRPSPQTTASVDATPSPNVREGVRSEQGLFIGSWSSDPAVPPINVVHEWVLHIETADGQPVDGANVAVGGDMPAHGHGMPTQPQVTAELGNGDYRVEGMSFQMGGYWIIDVTVTADGRTDVIRFGLDL